MQFSSHHCLAASLCLSLAIHFCLVTWTVNLSTVSCRTLICCMVWEFHKWQTMSPFISSSDICMWSDSLRTLTGQLSHLHHRTGFHLHFKNFPALHTKPDIESNLMTSYLPVTGGCLLIFWMHWSWYMVHFSSKIFSCLAGDTCIGNRDI